MTETLEPLLSVNEASRILGVSRNTTWRRIYEGLLPGIKLGGRVLVHPDDLRAYIATGRGRLGERTHLRDTKGGLLDRPAHVRSPGPGATYRGAGTDNGAPRKAV